MKTLKTPEGKLMKACLEWLSYHKSLGFFFRTNQSTAFFDQDRQVWIKRRGAGYVDGISDIVGVLANGRAIFIECKSSVGKQSPSQMEFEIMVKRNNGIYCVVRSLDDLQKIFPKTKEVVSANC